MRIVFHTFHPFIHPTALSLSLSARRLMQRVRKDAWHAVVAQDLRVSGKTFGYGEQLAPFLDRVQPAAHL